LAKAFRAGQHRVDLEECWLLAHCSPWCCDAGGHQFSGMIILVGLCLAVMTFLHWVLEPLEFVLTPVLQFNLIPWVLLVVGVWLFAAPVNKNSP
jgi:hypothetical protein